MVRFQWIVTTTMLSEWVAFSLRQPSMSANFANDSIDVLSVVRELFNFNYVWDTPHPQNNWLPVQHHWRFETMLNIYWIAKKASLDNTLTKLAWNVWNQYRLMWFELLVQFMIDLGLQGKQNVKGDRCVKDETFKSSLSYKQREQATGRANAAFCTGRVIQGIRHRCDNNTNTNNRQRCRRSMVKTSRQARYILRQHLQHRFARITETSRQTTGTHRCWHDPTPFGRQKQIISLSSQ